MLQIPNSPQEWAIRLMGVIVMILSLTVHEWAHAWSAYRLGDDTALRAGRLTLNPLVHIDPVGTLLLPLIGVPLGWARPVPFNPARFRRGVTMSVGTMITKAAGPLSNVVLALVCAVGLGLLYRAGHGLAASQPALRELLGSGLLMNVGLALFNLLPVEPLDGAGVIAPLVPQGLQAAWASYLRAGPIILMLLLFANYRLNFLSGPIDVVTRLLVGLAQTIAA
jgi:Zn-dependent protease